jgi:hypothetical protein
LASGSHDVTGVEINPIIATTIMRRKYPELSRNLYLRPDVHIEVEDGRSYVRRSNQKFQVLQATLVDTWASTAAGAFALSENNLYTSDAFRDYLNHLTDDGLLTFTRWGFSPPRESLRLISLAIVALHQVGEDDPAQHVIVGREFQDALRGWGARDTVMISRKALSANDVERARQAIADGHMTAIYLPNAGIRNEFTELLTTTNPARFEKDYQFNITPVSDNQPFFFYTVQPRDLLAFFTGASHDAADYKVNVAVPMLFESLFVSILAVAIILTLPPLVLGTRLPREKSVLVFLLYFLFIGAGYILIEVVPGASYLRFNGSYLFPIGFFGAGQLLQPGLDSRRRRPLAESATCSCALSIDARGGRIFRAGSGSRLAAAGEDHADYHVYLPGRFRDGHAISDGVAAPGTPAFAFHAVGLVAERGGQRIGLGGRSGMRHLSWISADPAGGWRAVSVRALSAGERPASGTSHHRALARITAPYSRGSVRS